MAEFPQVLLLGNGINIAYGGASWKALLKRITKKEEYLVRDMKSPMPLRAILLTNNHIRGVLKQEQTALMGCVENDQQAECYRKLLTMGFDHILTTNYSYELESAAINETHIKESRLKKFAAHTKDTDRAEPKYMLHTYNACTVEEKQNKIWHIHGEARKPDSMVLGHYYYGNLFSKIKQIAENRKDSYFRQQQENASIAIESWVDAFILGDVYVLGFGYDLSEFDLWWLLSRKDREKAKTGKLYYFDPSSGCFDEKLELLKVYTDTVEHIDCGITIPSDASNEQITEIYKEFYDIALKKIQTMITEKESNHV